MKTAIAPSVCAVLTVFVTKYVNPELEILGYIISLALGASIGAAINYVIFKEDPPEKCDTNSIEQ